MTQIKLKGCDISHWQRTIMFSQLKNEVDFVIIKAGGTDTTDFFYVDPQFENYYKYCKAQKIPVGCYFFAGKDAKGKKAGLREAEYFYNIIKDKKFEMPIYLDFEKGKPKDKDLNTDYCRAFCEYMQNRGYFIGIYASDVSGFKDMLDKSRLSDFSMWVARYGKKPEYIKNFGMWQYTSTGKLKSVMGNVDLDYAYLDFPKIIKSKHLNGY